MKVLHVYNQWQVFHISGVKVRDVCNEEGLGCIFCWVDPNKESAFNSRYGSFASFTVNGDEANLYLNVDAELLSSIIQWIQTKTVSNASPELIELASVMGFHRFTETIQTMVQARCKNLKNLILSAVTKGVKTDVASEIIENFFEDYQFELVNTPPILCTLFKSLDDSTEVEHVI